VASEGIRPPDVPALFREGDRLRWDYPAPPRDFAGFKLASQPGLNRSWATAVPAHDELLSASTFDLSGIPRGLRTVLVAAFDVAGNRSAGVAALVVDLGDPLVDNVIETVDPAARGFPGTVTGGALVAGALTATSLGQAFWTNDPEPLWTGMAQPLWTELSFHGINTSRQMAETVTHVSGTNRLGSVSQRPGRWGRTR